MLHHAGPPDPLSLRLAGPSLPERLSAVRRQVGRWAAAAGLPQESVDDVVLATHEALANVADHAYRRDDGPAAPTGGAAPDEEGADEEGAGEEGADEEGCGDAWLEVGTRAGDVVVVVRDRGTWRPPVADPGWRGRGMVIIRGLADHVDVRHGPGGTTVEMRWHLP